MALLDTSQYLEHPTKWGGRNDESPLLERVRCLILNDGLPKNFWGEALATSTYLINIYSSSNINNKTLMELWSGVPMDYSNLTIFGCLSYAHVTNDKLEPRAIRCIFIGYTDVVKGYMVWNL